MRSKSSYRTRLENAPHDTSALLPLVVDEPPRERFFVLLEKDGEVLAWGYAG